MKEKSIVDNEEVKVKKKKTRISNCWKVNIFF